VKALLPRRHFFLLLPFLISIALPAWADLSIQDLRKLFKPPSAEWIPVKLTAPEDILNFDHKKLGKALNISGRSDPMPAEARVYLEETRTGLSQDRKNYEGAQINLVESASVAGKSWETFKVIARDGLKQELWTRKISPSQVVLFLYTGMGDSYDQYRGDFEKILVQASKL